jgi:hypothetical protein
MITTRKMLLISLLLVHFCLAAGKAMADTAPGPSRGQTVYVPVYSHIYSGDQERPFYLAATLSIRNTDPRHSISLLSVDYFDTEGKLLRKYLDKPITLKEMASIRYVIKQSDKTGGSGANFLVKWKADREINPPIIESIMIGTQMQQGISFTSRGQIIID